MLWNRLKFTVCLRLECIAHINTTFNLMILSFFKKRPVIYGRFDVAGIAGRKGLMKEKTAPFGKSLLQ